MSLLLGVQGLLDRTRALDFLAPLAMRIYLAPVFFGGDDARPLFAGPGAESISTAWRGRIISVDRLGPDVRVVLDAVNPDRTGATER